MFHTKRIFLGVLASIRGFASNMDVPRLYILIGLVAFAAVDHVASQTDEECRFSSSARRRRCPFGVRRGDRIGCIRQ